MTSPSRRALRAARRAGEVVLAMGTFDGVHRGHRAILQKASARARALGIPSLAMTFRRPPRELFFPSAGPSLLTLSHEKRSLIQGLGVDGVEELSFGRRLARLSAEDFFSLYVLERWGAREIVVGYNFRFGRDRAGDAKLLATLGAPRGIPVHIVSPVTYGGSAVSSGIIRRLLAAGELAGANALLGYDYLAAAPVVRGDGLGVRLGFPTANLDTPREKILPPGVFAVRVRLPDGREKGGMANVGTRPTLGDSGGRPRAEVHIFRFRENLVGKELTVSFVKKIREERRFASLELLRRRLTLDARAARAAL